MPIDEARMQAFLGQAVGDIGAAMSAVLALIGDKLGLYKAMAGAGPMTIADLARKTRTTERYIREWLGNQAAGGYVAYDAKSDKYTLPPEQATALADENSPYFISGAWEVIAALFKAEPRMVENFRTGGGLDWGEHDCRLFSGTERFFRPNYRGNLISSWIPALDGVEAKLTAGARAADIGCGHGASTILMAQSYPKSRFLGFDMHAPSIETANERAREAGVADRVTFDVASSTDYPGSGFDFVAHFDCLHDMGDPAGAAKHVAETLDRNGTWMIVEPLASDRVEGNLNPVGRVFYAASTMVCVPASLAHHGPALGAQAGEKRLREVISAGGFSRVRRAAETPFNLVLEARL